jgi:hypothetical protein
MLPFHNNKQLLQKPGYTLEYINIGDTMECLDPLDKDHLAVLIFGALQLLTDGIDQLVQVEHQTFV